MNTSTVRVSRKFIAAIKLHPSLKQYEIAQQANIDPGQLSRMVRHRQVLRPNDARVIRVAEVVGLKPTQAFEKNGTH